jgi:hypothetical protein
VIAATSDPHRQEESVAPSVDPVLAHLVDDLTALGGFGVAVELTVAIDSLVVTGTPISDSEYFARLGEQFRKTVEPAFSGLSIHLGTEADKELKRGWDEDQLWELSQAREQGYRLFGQDVQQGTRERVQERPRRIREYPEDESELRALRVRLAESLGNHGGPSRQFLHLQNATIITGETLCGTLPYWRIRLIDVSGWYLGRPESSDS